MTTPKLRFQGFDNDWKLIFTRDIFINISEKNNANERVLSVTQDNGLVYRDNLDIDISYNRDSLKNYKTVHPNNVVISLRSFQGGFEISNKTGIVSPAYTVMDFKSKNYTKDSIYFWKTLLKSYEFLQALKKVTYGIRDGRSISYKDFSSLQINIANTEEQSKIGRLFYFIDNQIKFKREKLNLFKSIRESYLKNLFKDQNKATPKLRFVQFKEIWDKKHLVDFSEKINQKNSKLTYSDVFTNSALHGVIEQNDFFKKDIANPKNIDKYTIVENNYYIYNPRISKYAEFGPIKRNKLGKTGVASPMYFVFKITSDDVYKLFLDNYFNSNHWYKYVYSVGNSGVRSDRIAIKDDDFMNMPIPLPSYNEQRKIGDLVSLIDRQINLQKKELDLFISIKKGYLQKMFV